jgi:hypothetical protein
LESLENEISGLVPKLVISHKALPYLMATYKQHKNKYRWLTNAFHILYSNLAHLLTISTMTVLEYVKEWATKTVHGYSNFLRCDTSPN